MQTLDVHGAQIPILGFGTWQLSGDTCRDRVAQALDTGYRHIDTARMYGNEADVGAGLKQGGTARDEVFLTTKVWPDDAADGAFQRALEDSLQKLGTDYVDLVLLHWPSKEVPFAETARALADVRERGLARHVGVSNFTVKLLREAAEACPVPLVVNQVEYHPFLDQRPVLEELARRDMGMIAYSPIAQGKVMKDDTLRAIGEAHGKNAAQVTLRWLVQQGVAAIPRTAKPDHLQSNFDIWDFELSQSEMSRISSMRSKKGRLISPEGIAPDWD